jgi:hypothetical protein
MQHLIYDMICDFKVYTKAARGNYPIGRPDVILTVGRGWSLQALA